VRSGLKAIHFLLKYTSEYQFGHYLNIFSFQYIVLNDKFLSGLESLPSPGSQQPTFMEIAGYPHFENVCSNILQFYLTPTNEHGFGRLLLDSLLILVDRELINDEQNIEVRREVCTSENNRIDLVIIADNYIIGIENKIHAKVDNPFCDYAKHLNSLHKDPDKVHKILLSVHPEKDLTKLRCFKPVSFSSFLREVQDRFTSCSQNAINEHLIFLKDFIQTMKNLQNQSIVDSQWLTYLKDKDDDIKVLLAEIAIVRKDMRMKLKQLEQLIIESEISSHFTERWFWTDPTFFGDVLVYTINPDKSPLFFAVILTSKGWKMQFWNKQTDLEKYNVSEKEMLRKWFGEKEIDYLEVTGHGGSGWRIEFDGFKDKVYETRLEEIMELVVDVWNRLNKNLEGAISL
jgi:PD-(D/E)XK nuclease superfamily